MKFIIKYIWQGKTHTFDQCTSRREAGVGVALLRSKGFNAWYVMKCFTTVQPPNCSVGSA